MTHQKQILDYLESQPKFRERRNKDKGIVNLLAKRYPTFGRAISSGEITKKVAVAILQDYTTYDRSWRQMLEKHPHLRGSDYPQKATLEKKKQGELGYTVNAG